MFKEKVLTRIGRTLSYYGDRQTLDQRLEALRAAGATIGQRVVLYDTLIDPVHTALVTIGNDCTLTGATVLCHDDSLVLFEGVSKAAPVIIGSRVFIGRGAIVLAGVTIGSDVIVGAGSVVTRDVPFGHVVAGNPARVVRTLAEHLELQRDDPAVLREVPLPSNLIEDPELLARLREAGQVRVRR